MVPTKLTEWESTGADGYTIKEAEKADNGTEITLHLKEDTEDEKYGDYLNEYTIRTLITQVFRLHPLSDQDDGFQAPDQTGSWRTRNRKIRNTKRYQELEVAQQHDPAVEEEQERADG